MASIPELEEQLIIARANLIAMRRITSALDMVPYSNQLTLVTRLQNELNRALKEEAGGG